MARTRTLLPLLAGVGLIASMTACADVATVDAIGDDFALEQAPTEAYGPDVVTEAAQGDARLERRLAHMTDFLELDEAQVAQVRPILEAAHARHEAGDQEIHESVREQLEGVLDETQQERFAEMHERHQARRAERREGRGHHRRGPGRSLERMQAQLELSDAQAEQVRPILEGAHERRRAARELEPEERRAAMQALHTEVRGELADVLSEEQLTRFTEMHQRRQERGARGEGRGHQGGPGRFLERMQERLELSDAEVEQVRPILAAAHERRRGLRDVGPEERRAAMQALHSEVRGELAGVLSEEQLGRLDEMHERMRARHEGRRGRHGQGRRGHGRGHGGGGFGGGGGAAVGNGI